MALLKSDQKDMIGMTRIADYLVESRCYGGFGSTQATILALKSLTEFAKFSKHTADDGKIEIFANGKLIGEKHYEKNTRGEIIIDNLQRSLGEGKYLIKIKYSDTENAIPYSVDASWTSMTPASSDQCVVDLSTSLNETEIKVGENVRMNVSLTNKSKNGQPMTVAIVGIPAGLSGQPWQLKEMQEKGVFDYYEIHNNYLVIYYRQMVPEEEKFIALDLKAEVAGNYEAPASTAYLYYTNEHKKWVEGSKIVVNDR
jgi:hypothetical protein